MRASGGKLFREKAWQKASHGIEGKADSLYILMMKQYFKLIAQPLSCFGCIQTFM
jgi:hypothetical protein